MLRPRKRLTWCLGVHCGDTIEFSEGRRRRDYVVKDVGFDGERNEILLRVIEVERRGDTFPVMRMLRAHPFRSIPVWTGEYHWCSMGIPRLTGS